MKNIIKIGIVSFLSVLIPILSWKSYDIFVISHCDPKLGCAGSFQFNLFIYSTSAIIVAIAFSLSFYLLYKKFTSPLTKSTYLIIMIAGSIQGLLIPLYLRNAIGEVPVMILGWFLISFIISLSIYKIKKNIMAKDRF